MDRNKTGLTLSLFNNVKKELGDSFDYRVAHSLMIVKRERMIERRELLLRTLNKVFPNSSSVDVMEF